jgi:peptidoglycan/LPS O-acetylase OafA/YrhL
MAWSDIWRVGRSDLEAGFNRNLHGLRGLLALAVVVGHSGIADLGTVAVWFFFVLSGYLLAAPYQRGMRADQLWRYAVRRFARIYPLYATCLILIAVIPSGFYALTLHPQAAVQFEAVAATAEEHLTFLRANMHLWTLAQEALGYVLIAVLLLVRGRMSNALFVSLCLALIVLCSIFLTADVLPMHTDGKPRQFHASLFIIGMLVATVPALPPKPWYSQAALGLLAAVFVAGVFHTQVCRLFWVPYWHAIIPVVAWGALAAVVVLFLANGSDKLDSLAFFGTVSYGLYVFHFFAVLIVAGRNMNAPQTLLAVFAISLPLACLGYRYIEAPCIRLSRQITKRSRASILPKAA